MPEPSLSGSRFPLRSTACALVVAALAAPSPLWAQAGGSFAPFAGSFHGGGQVVGSDGHRERISCRANGAIGGGGRSLTQNIVCASDSYRMDIRGQAIDEGGSVRGRWQETTRGVSGELSGRLSEGRFSGGVSGGGFTASFSLRSTGRRMSFDLRPEGGDVARVEVSLSK